MLAANLISGNKMNYFKQKCEIWQSSSTF